MSALTLLQDRNVEFTATIVASGTDVATTTAKRALELTSASTFAHLRRSSKRPDGGRTGVSFVMHTMVGSMTRHHAAATGRACLRWR